MTGRPANGFGWRFVVGAAPIGLLFAALTITGSIDGLRPTKWVALGLLAAIGAWVALSSPGRPFLHGLAAGFTAGLVAIETQALFLDTYFANNPEYAHLEMPFGWSPRLATAVLGPLNALLAGLVTGALAWLLWKVRRTRSANRRNGR